MTHPDTDPFDTWSETFDKVRTAVSGGGILALRLSSVDVWYRRSVNGIRVHGTYAGAIAPSQPVAVESAIHRGEHDVPLTHTAVDLSSDEEIVSLTVRCGYAVVDSLIFETSSGRRVRVGSSHESDCAPRVLQVPHGTRLVGFAGGTGGHLHNIALVVAAPPAWRPDAQALEQGEVSPA